MVGDTLKTALFFPPPSQYPKELLQKSDEGGNRHTLMLATNALAGALAAIFAPYSTVKVINEFLSLSQPLIADLG